MEMRSVHLYNELSYMRQERQAWQEEGGYEKNA